MNRSAVVLLTLPALAAPVLAGASASAAPTQSTIKATVDSFGAKGETLSLTSSGRDAGQLVLKPCVNTSPTAIVCTGHGTVLGLGPGKVRIRWHCPAGRTCEGHAEGTLKNNGSTLALLHVKAGVAAFQSEGASFKIAVETVGE